MANKLSEMSAGSEYQVISFGKRHQFDGSNGDQRNRADGAR